MSIDRIELAKQFRVGVTTFASGTTTITDNQVLSKASLFPVWPPDTPDLWNWELVTVR